MKTKITGLLIVWILGCGNLFAQDKITVEATSHDISENLDLEAVASLFGEAKDLEDFEKRLNDPNTQISNLDLNEDGEVDYLRVMETVKGKTHLITLQAILGEDSYQDVAVIAVEKDSDGETNVQVIGDVYMYGPDYIIQPIYIRPPLCFIYFWGRYHPWRSPCYWRHYPAHYRRWRPHPVHHYQRNVNVHINTKNSYSHTTVRKSSTSVELQKTTRRNDFEVAHPNTSFTHRNKGVTNQQPLSNNQKPTTGVPPTQNDLKKSTGKPVQTDWKPASSNKKSTYSTKTKPSIPSTAPIKQKPANKPAPRPSKPVQRR